MPVAPWARVHRGTRWACLICLFVVGCDGAVVMGDGGVSSADGAPRDRDASTPERPPTPVTVAPLFPMHAGWNDYVAAEPGAPTEWADVPCEPDGDCAHGGVMRVATLPGASSCEGLEARDDRGVFEWRCVESAEGVRVYSVRVAPDRGLRELVTRDGFRESALIVERDGIAVFESARRPWWDDPVVPLALDAAETVELDAEGTVYVVEDEAPSAGVRVAADRVALAGLEGAGLAFTGAPNADPDQGGAGSGAGYLLSVPTSGARQLWIEGLWLDGAGTAHAAVFAPGASWSRFHRLEVTGAIEVGFDTGTRDRFARFQHNHVSSLHAHDNGAGDQGIGVRVRGESAHNTWSDLTLVDNRQIGLQIRAAHQDVRGLFASGHALYIIHQPSSGVDVQAGPVRLTDVVTLGNQLGVAVRGANDIHVARMRSDSDGTAVRLRRCRRSVVTELFATNSGSIAFQSGHSSDPVDSVSDNVLSRFLVAGVDGVGLSFRGSGNTLAHGVVANTSGVAIELLGDGTTVVSVATLSSRAGLTASGDTHVADHAALDHRGAGLTLASADDTLAGALVVGGNGDDCAGASSALVTPSCTSSGGEGSVTPSGARLLPGRSGGGAFAGWAATEDANSTPGARDNAGLDPSSITDWLGFASPLRAWAVSRLERAAFPDRSACAEGIGAERACFVFDWALETESALHAGFEPFVAGDACPASASGDAAVTDSRATPNEFLLRAVERSGDEIGDDDGLCESGEGCLHAPAVGARGDGEVSGECAFQDGRVREVRLFGPTR